MDSLPRHMCSPCRRLVTSDSSFGPSGRIRRIMVRAAENWYDVVSSPRTTCARQTIFDVALLPPLAFIFCWEKNPCGSQATFRGLFCGVLFGVERRKVSFCYACAFGHLSRFAHGVAAGACSLDPRVDRSGPEPMRTWFGWLLSPLVG